MGPEYERVLQAALALSDDEREELLNSLLHMRNEGRVLDETWVAEIRRRSAEYDAGTVTPIPWATVRERAGKGDHPRG